MSEILHSGWPYQVAVGESVATGWIGGRIMSHAEIEALIAALRAYYDNRTPEEIDEANWQLRLNRPVHGVFKAKPGIVYLVYSPESDLYKIGITFKSVENRVMQIEKETGESDIAILHTIEAENATILEKAIQQALADKNDHGEWFKLSQLDVDRIKAIGGES